MTHSTIDFSISLSVCVCVSTIYLFFFSRREKGEKTHSVLFGVGL